MNSLKSSRVQLQEAIDLLDRAISNEKISLIERDLLLDKLRQVYDEIVFCHGGPQKQHVEKPIVQATAPKKVEPTPEIPPRTKTPEIKMQGGVQAKLLSEGPKDIPSEKTLRPDVVAVKSESTNGNQTKHVSPTEEIVITPPIEGVQPYEETRADRPTPETLGEKYQGKRKFRNETISGQSPRKDVASKLQSKPIHDLTKAIGINDKFLFIKELFGGSSEEYHRTIKTLNEYDNLNDALFYIHENFDWGIENDAANKLIELVRRKLMVEE